MILLAAIILAVTAGAIANPVVPPSGSVDINLLLAIITIALAAMGTLIGIFGRKTKESDAPSDSNTYCKIKNEDMKRVKETANENKTENKRIGEVIHKLDLAVQDLKTKADNRDVTIKEMKEDNKALVGKLEKLLSQLVDFIRD